MSVGVGGTIWVFDLNRRFYTKPSGGRLWGEPIWRRHWRPLKIVGETSRSWILESRQKVPKRGADPTVFAFSEADIDRMEWVHYNAYRIADKVLRLRDYETLRKVADAIGYREPPKGEQK